MHTYTFLVTSEESLESYLQQKEWHANKQYLIQLHSTLSSQSASRLADITLTLPQRRDPNWSERSAYDSQ